MGGKYCMVEGNETLSILFNPVNQLHLMGMVVDYQNCTGWLGARWAEQMVYLYAIDTVCDGFVEPSSANLMWYVYYENAFGYGSGGLVATDCVTATPVYETIMFTKATGIFKNVGKMMGKK